MWTIAKTLQIPLDSKLKHIHDLPYTVSYVIRKYIQIDNLSELPKEKRPPDRMIWDGTSDDIDEWLDKVFDHKTQRTVEFEIDEDDIG